MFCDQDTTVFYRCIP